MTIDEFLKLPLESHLAAFIAVRETITHDQSAEAAIRGLRKAGISLTDATIIELVGRYRARIAAVLEGDGSKLGRPETFGFPENAFTPARLQRLDEILKCLPHESAADGGQP